MGKFNPQVEKMLAKAGTKQILNRIQIPNDWSSLDEFATWYRNAGFPILPLQDSCINMADITYSLIVFRKGRFQVELYLVAPNSDNGLHTHPHASKFVHCAGAGEGYNETETIALGQNVPAESPDEIDKDFGLFAPSTVAYEKHGLRTSNRGVAFFNIEMWPDDGSTPTSALIEFIGKSVGPMHDEIKSANPD
jgi:hypothetical protein